MVKRPPGAQYSKGLGEGSLVPGIGRVLPIFEMMQHLVEHHRIKRFRREGQGVKIAPTEDNSARLAGRGKLAMGGRQHSGALIDAR